MSILGSVGLAACAAPTAEIAPAPAAPDVRVAAPAPEDRTPAGAVRVAYPDEAAALLDLHGDDPAAADRHALWGLPLFRLDQAGQLRPGLVADWEVLGDAAGPFTVSVRLRPGRWSDGTPVTAEDVVATIAAVREGPRAVELTPLVRAVAVARDEVHLRFDRPYTRWPSILEGVGVLPAAVLEERGIAAYADDLPVTGGWFRLSEREVGHRAVFEAHREGPLGAPGVERVEVLVVPRYEAALGLLDRGEVDAAIGYLALNAVDRAHRVAGVDAAAPLGGTAVHLRWRPDGALGGSDAAVRRRAIAAAIDVSQLVEGLLGPAGEVATSLLPGVPGPRPVTSPPAGEVGEPLVALPRWHEALAFTGRAVQRDLRTAGGGLQLRTEPSPSFVPLARESVDGSLAVARTGPRPSFAGAVHDRAVALAADAAAPGTPAFADGLEAAAADALVWPLYRIGVGHVWRPTIGGFVPSAWPGVAFWNAGEWTVTDG